MNAEFEWEVKRIRTFRKYYRKLQYQADWKGWNSEDKWYNAINFKNSPELVKAFHEEYPSQPGPPARLKDWLETAHNGKVLDDYPDNNKPKEIKVIPRYGKRRKRDRYS